MTVLYHVSRGNTGRREARRTGEDTIRGDGSARETKELRADLDGKHLFVRQDGGVSLGRLRQRHTGRHEGGLAHHL